MEAGTDGLGGVLIQHLSRDAALGGIKPGLNRICSGISKDNEKDFYVYKGDERKNREKVGPLLNEAGNLLTQEMEKAEVLNSS